MCRFCVGQRRPHLLSVRARSAFTSGDHQRTADKNLMSKKIPDQSPSLGLDSRKSGARLCADRMQAKRGVPVFPS